MAGGVGGGGGVEVMDGQWCWWGGGRCGGDGWPVVLVGIGGSGIY